MLQALQPAGTPCSWASCWSSLRPRRSRGLISARPGCCCRDSGRAKVLTEEERTYLEKAPPRDRRARAANRRIGRAPPNAGSPRCHGRAWGSGPSMSSGRARRTRGTRAGCMARDATSRPPPTAPRRWRQPGPSGRWGPAAGRTPTVKIVLISNGMSNTTREFQVFVKMARQEPEINPRLAVVDCAQGGQEAGDWARSADRFRRETRDPWEVQAERLRQPASRRPRCKWSG